MVTAGAVTAIAIVLVVTTVAARPERRSPALASASASMSASVGAMPRPWIYPHLGPGVVPRLDGDLRNQLIDAAEEALEAEARPRDPLSISKTTDPFVRDARAAWTLALAARVTGGAEYARAAAALVDAWMTVDETRKTCPHSGGCSTSLMVSRAAPGFVFAVAALRAEGLYGGARLERFHRWLRTVVLPAASDRANNWGDAGTFLRAAVAVELGDREELDRAVALWKGRIDLMDAEGRIPEEMRRGRGSLMYSQEALGYRVMAAALFETAGIDVWDDRGRGGGSLRRGLELVAAGLADPDGWPAQGSVRVPRPAPMWSLVADRWPTPPFERQAARAREDDGGGHSAVAWLAVTHGA